MASMSAPAKNVVLVHGGFVDGSGWQGVYDILTGDGYNVRIVQNPTLSLGSDVAAARQIIVEQQGPVVLVGHSYGGVVISEAGNLDNVVALVYVAAYAPDQGESVSTLIADPSGAPAPPVLPPKEGFVFLDRTKFAASIAGDLPARQVSFMADSQVPCGVDALRGSVTNPAWRSKPSWYLVTAVDKMIAADAQRAMSQRAGAVVAEIAAGHFVYISQPAAVAEVIEQAASAACG